METVILIVGIITMISVGASFVPVEESPHARHFAMIMMCILTVLLTIHEFVA